MIFAGLQPQLGPPLLGPPLLGPPLHGPAPLNELLGFGLRADVITVAASVSKFATGDSETLIFWLWCHPQFVQTLRRLLDC